MVRDVVVHRIGRATLADAPATEGHTLQGLHPVRSVGIGKGSGIVVPRARRIECLGFRPVGEVCVVGFHGGPGLDLCRQVKQIVRRLQVIGSVGGDIAVDIVGIVVPTVTGVGVREGGRCAGIIVPGKSCDVARPVVGDTFLGEGIGGGAATVVLPGSEAVCAVVSEGVGLGRLFVLGPGPGGDVSGVAGGSTGLDRGIIPQGHGEDVGGPLHGRPGGQPTLDVPAVRGGDCGGPAAGRGGLQTREVAIEKRQSHKLEWP